MVGVGALSFIVSATIIVSSRDYFPRNDSLEYASLAKAVLHGHGLGTTFDPAGRHGTRAVWRPAAYRGPAYPLALTPAFALASGFTLARLLTAALGAVMVTLLFAVVRELWGFRPALLSGVIAAVFPPFVATNVGLFTEPLFLMLELAALLALLVFRRTGRGWRWPVAIGVLAGLATLTRSNGFVLVPLFAAGVWWTAAGRRRAMVAAAAVLLAATLTITPWIVRNALAFGRFVPVSTQAGYSLIVVFNDRSRAADGDFLPVYREEFAAALRRNPNLDGEELGSELTKRALRYARAHPRYAIKAMVLNVLRTLELADGRWTGFFSYGGNGVRPSPIWRLLVPASYLVYVLALVGFVGMLRTRSIARPPAVFYLIPVVLLLSSAPIAGALRYRAPVDPFLIAFAGLGLAVAGERLVRFAAHRGAAAQLR